MPVGPLNDCEEIFVVCRGLESVRIGKCQNRKVSELESVRIGKCQNLKVSEFESVRIGTCQNRKVSELESVRIFKFFEYRANDAWVTIMVQTMASETSIGPWHILKLLLKHNLAHL